jgi:hypothetical protein
LALLLVDGAATGGESSAPFLERSYPNLTVADVAHPDEAASTAATHDPDCVVDTVRPGRQEVIALFETLGREFSHLPIVAFPPGGDRSRPTDDTQQASYCPGCSPVTDH